MPWLIEFGSYFHKNLDNLTVAAHKKNLTVNITGKKKNLLNLGDPPQRIVRFLNNIATLYVHYLA